MADTERIGVEENFKTLLETCGKPIEPQVQSSVEQIDELYPVIVAALHPMTIRLGDCESPFAMGVRRVVAAYQQLSPEQQYKLHVGFPIHVDDLARSRFYNPSLVGRLKDRFRIVELYMGYNNALPIET